MGNEALRRGDRPESRRLPRSAAIAGVPGARRTRRSFVFPVLAVCLAWYLAYVLLAVCGRPMSTRVFGSINVAILLGLAQVVTTFAVTMWYVHYANKHLDPKAERIREEIETGTFADAADEEVALMFHLEAASTSPGNLAQHRDLRRLRRDHDGHRVPRQPEQQDRGRLLRGRPLLHGGQNGSAIAGDYLSPRRFLGIVGAIAMTGYDRFLYSIGFLVAWLVAPPARR